MPRDHEDLRQPQEDQDNNDAQFTFIVQAQRLPYNGPITRTRARQMMQQDQTVHFEIEATLPPAAANDNGTPTDQVLQFLAHINEIFASNTNFEQYGISVNLAQAVMENRNNILARLFNAVTQGHIGSQQGQPPASKEAKYALRCVVKIGRKILQRDGRCSICLEDFEAGSHGKDEDCVFGTTSKKCSIRMMPCSHIYHQECLFQWLNQSNYCPQCRYELLTDNVQYNALVMERMKDRDHILQQEKRKAEEEAQPVRQLRRRKTQQ